MSRRFIEKFIYIAFAAAGLITTIAITVSDFVFGYDTTFIKYGGIIACALYSLYTAVKGKVKFPFVTFALCFTLLADYFLLVKNDGYIYGVSAFIVAQSFYLARIYFEKGKLPVVSVAVRVAAFSVLCIAMFIARLIEPLTAAVAFYACMIVGNAVESFSLCKLGVRYIVFAVGLCLFIGCDVCVGIYNLSSFINIGLTARAAETFVFLSWTFYLPSQVMIALSTDGIF